MRTTAWNSVQRIVRSSWILCCALAASLLLGAAQSSAKVLFRDDLGVSNALREIQGGVLVDTAYGKGWLGTKEAWPHPWQKGFGGSEWVGYRIGSEKIPARAGAIEILAVNKARNESASEPDALVEFASAKEKNGLFVVTVDWNGDGGTVIGFEGYGYRSEKFSRAITVQSIPKGERLHLMVAWNDSGLVRTIVANGITYEIELPFESAGGSRLRKKEKQEIYPLLKGADTLRLGILSHRSEFWPEGEMPSNDTVILAVALHDDPADPAVLLQPAGSAATLTSVAHNAAQSAGFSGKLVAGNTLTVTATGTPGVPGGFDIGRIADENGKITLDWRGLGVYMEEKVFFEADEINLRDVEEYRVYLSKAPFDSIAAEMVPVTTLKVTEQTFTSEILERDVPYYAAVVAAMKDGSARKVIWPLVNLPLTEREPGVYQGTHLISYLDRYPKAAVVAHLGSGEGAAFLQAQDTFAMDPALTISVSTSPEVLQADEKSTSNVTVTVTDANGNAVAGHKVRCILATTSQYTGVVGGGAFAEQVGGEIAEIARGETDLFGRVTAVYRAGFAAKTAIIVARDMASNDTGAGWVKTYIKASAELELERVVETAAMDAGYEIAVTSSDEWLTADGRSTARISARVTLSGEPVEGHVVDFSVSSGAGSIRTVKETTDKNGIARAVYTAGKKIGIVLITATDRTVGISGSVQIELRSDAPAKITIKIAPEKLPADGRSTAELQVLVTDINDNPNENTEVEYQIARGGGSLEEDRTLTDRKGECTNTYRAGRDAGKVTIELTVRSTVPSDEELASARDLAVAVTDYDFF